MQQVSTNYASAGAEDLFSGGGKYVIRLYQEGQIKIGKKT